MHEKQIEALVSQNDPIFQLNNKEFNDALIKFGSFVSIIKNKRLSQTFILLQLLEDKDLRNIFHEICEIEEFQPMLMNFLVCYPSLSKSKIIKAKINQLFNKTKPKKSKDINDKPRNKRL